MTTFFSAAAPSIINHLLAQEPWARERLSRHAGKVAVIDAGLIALRIKVSSDGLTEMADVEQSAHVTIRIKPADLPLILQNRERAFSYVTIDGDAEFANTISQLSQTLRWEAEEDLSKWIGDIAAQRMVAAAKRGFARAKSAQRSVAENVAEYFLEENPMLMRPEAVTDFGSAVNTLRDDVERLAKRIEKLSKQ